MSGSTSAYNNQTLRLLRAELHQADDTKVRQIVALIDNLPERESLQPLLEPIRPRLASLQPHRPLRFTRLLFIPFDSLIVAPANWRPGTPGIPRSILQPISEVVRAGLGEQAAAVERMISKHDTGAATVVAQAGSLVWAAAADILPVSAPPGSWAETGLRPAAYASLVRALAAVFRRALPLWNLRRDAELGVVKASESDIKKLVDGVVTESADGSLMVCKQILTYVPTGASLLSAIAASSGETERTILRSGIERATEEVLSAFERNPLPIEAGCAPTMAAELQRVSALFGQLTERATGGPNVGRLHAVRKTLDSALRSRLAGRMADGIVKPLTELSAVADAACQHRLETNARAVRALEMAGRKFGDPATYDALTATAIGAIAKASGRGDLDRLKTTRLVEILAGPDAAEAFYQSGRL